MKGLSETWYAEGYIDFELKKYTLLAYLQEVNKCFQQHKLYPPLADLVFHYNNLLNFKRNKAYLQQQFPKRLTGLDIQRIEMLYEHMIQDDALMQEMEDIMQYALENLKETIDGGAVIYDLVEEHLEIEPVGLLPVDHSEGYFFLRDSSKTDTWVYQYRISQLERHQEQYRTLSTQFVEHHRISWTVSLQTIKHQLIRNSTSLSVPAFFSIASRVSMPLEETLLPVGKRSLAKYLAQQNKPAGA